MPADLYTVLGVSRTDSDEAIRRAYKKLAMKWHPDRNSAPDAKAKFQDISRAYDVLGDASKRKIYDQYGEDGLRAAAAGHDPSAYAYAHDSGDEGSGGSSGGMGGVGGGGWQRGGTSSFSSQDAEELFRRFFGGGGGMGGVRGGSGGGPSVFTFSSGGSGGGGGQPHFFQQQQQQPKRGRTFSTGGGPFGGAGGGGGFYHPFGGMDSGMNVDSDDSDDGASAFFPHQRQYQQQSQPQQPQQPKSVVVTHKLPCTLEELASGFQRMFKISRKVQDAATGQVRADTNVLTVNGLPGWKAGTKITFADAGDQIVGAPRQDVQFVVEEKEHPRFKRVGDNLETEVVVPLVHALCGGAHLQVKSLGGDMLSLPSLPRVTPETTHTFPGQGMPRRDGSRGDLVVRFKVAFPDLSEAQKAAVRKVLPTS